jgi:hypothetical protein
MNILDKAKELSNRVTESVTDFSSDELIANTVIKAVAKQESVNALLKAKGSNYRVSGIDLEMGIPPTVSFGVRRINDQDSDSENDSLSESDVLVRNKS